MRWGVPQKKTVSLLGLQDRSPPNFPQTTDHGRIPTDHPLNPGKGGMSTKKTDLFVWQGSFVWGFPGRKKTAPHRPPTTHHHHPFWTGEKPDHTLDPKNRPLGPLGSQDRKRQEVARRMDRFNTSQLAVTSAFASPSYFTVEFTNPYGQQARFFVFCFFPPPPRVWLFVCFVLFFPPVFGFVVFFLLASSCVA